MCVDLVRFESGLDTATQVKVSKSWKKAKKAQEEVTIPSRLRRNGGSFKSCPLLPRIKIWGHARSYRYMFGCLVAWQIQFPTLKQERRASRSERANSCPTSFSLRGLWGLPRWRLYHPLHVDSRTNHRNRPGDSQDAIPLQRASSVKWLLCELSPARG